MSAFKVGDKVRVVVSCYEPRVPRGALLEVKEDKVLGPVWLNHESVEVSMLNAYAQEFEIVEKASCKPVEWTGEGLPPVGTVCEAWYDDGRVCWHQADVVGYNPYEPNTIAVSLKGDHGRKLIWSDHFRPIKTKEQLEAEKKAKEREKVVREIFKVLTGHTDTEGWSDTCYESHARNLYDAGLRFTGEKTNG